MIFSGFDFVFDEENSDLRRSMDGFLWSLSNIPGNSILYREMTGTIPDIALTGLNRSTNMMLSLVGPKIHTQRRQAT